jgi:hypothetical protein
MTFRGCIGTGALDRIAGVIGPRLDLRVLRVLTVVQVLGVILVRRAAATAMGVELPLPAYFLVSVSVPLLLTALVWVPGLVRRLGPRLLPFVAVLEVAHLLALKTILVGWLVAAPQRDLLSLMLLGGWQRPASRHPSAAVGIPTMRSPNRSSGSSQRR